RPGDVYLFNDPYTAAGQHLPDLYVIKPLFVGTELAGWACTMAHHCDVGGIAPGSTAMHATDILQEGLCIPGLKLYDRGAPTRPPRGPYRAFVPDDPPQHAPAALSARRPARAARRLLGRRARLSRSRRPTRARSPGGLLRRHAGAGRAHDALDHLRDPRRHLQL